jgi:hypothetical protein
MSYADSQRNQSITVGNLARKDPVIAYSSVMASSLLLQSGRQPAGKRLGWLRTQLNKAQPGLGDEVVSKYKEMTRQGKRRNQAVFDALRLSIANQLASYIDKNLPQHSAAGFGDTASDVRLGMCTGYAIGAGAGGATAGFLGDPAASAAVTEAMRVAAEIQGCNVEQLNAQARIAEANANTAAANAAAGAEEEEGMGTGMMIAIAGGGVLVLGLLGYAVLKK